MTLLEIIETGTEGRFVYPSPAPYDEHPFSVTCSCRHCESVWTKEES